MPRYIDRDIALSHPFANGQYDKENANEHFIFGYEGYKEWLEQLPTIDAEPVKHGDWLAHPYYKEWDVCSACGIGCKRREYGTNPDGSEWVTEETYSYCPHCGAKMSEE